MKALSTTMIIVVTVIVILIAALIVLTIFGGGVSQVATLSEAKALCGTQGKSTCQMTGTLPPTWGLDTMSVKDAGSKSCSELWDNCNVCPDSEATGSDVKKCNFG
jgi:hypothetical protein